MSGHTAYTSTNRFQVTDQGKLREILSKCRVAGDGAQPPALDSCGDMTLYTEMWGVGSKWMDGFEDALPAIRDCLEVQKMTGVQYYLEKVDRAVEKWLYALQLLADKGLLEKERALELARELGMAEKAMADARTAIDMKIEQARQRRDALKASPSASESMMAFLEQMGTAKEEDGGTVQESRQESRQESVPSAAPVIQWERQGEGHMVGTLIWD